MFIFFIIYEFVYLIPEALLCVTPEYVTYRIGASIIMEGSYSQATPLENSQSSSGSCEAFPHIYINLILMLWFISSSHFGFKFWRLWV